MIRKPRTVVVISPTDSPKQETYKTSFLAKLSKRFTPEIVCIPAFDSPPEDFRDSLRIAMRSAEESFQGRQDLEYAAHVLPMFMERDPRAPEAPPFPIVAITVRNWQRTEWITPYAIEPVVPQLILAEVSHSISTVLTERQSPPAVDQHENETVALLVHTIRKGIDAALDVTLEGNG